MKTYIVIHNTAVSEKISYDQFNRTNEYHKSEDFPISSLGIYVGYHRLITGGLNYKCRTDEEIGSHCNQEFDGVNIYPVNTGKALSMNIQSLGVCLAIDGDLEFPSDIHYQLLRKQLFEWQDKYNIPNKNIFFHRKFNTGKTCPGKLIHQDWLDKLLVRDPIPTDSCITTKVELEAEKQKVSNLQSFINSLLALFKKLYANR